MMDQAQGLRAMAAHGRQRILRHLNAFKTTRLLVVASGKGGVGKTNVALNLALALAEQKQVLLVDADLGLANVELLLGASSSPGLDDLIRGTHSLEEVIHPGPRGLRILPGGGAFLELSGMAGAAAQQLVGQLVGLEGREDIIMVDTGAGISRRVMAFLWAAREILVVTTPEPTALADAYGLIKMAANARPVPIFQVVINMADSERDARKAFNRLASVAGSFLEVRPRWLGTVLRDDAVPRAVRRQEPLVIAYPLAPASQSLRLIARRLLNEPEPEAGPGAAAGFFTRLARLARRLG